YQNGLLGLQETVRVSNNRPVQTDTELSSPPVMPTGLVATTLGRLIFNEKITETAEIVYGRGGNPLPYFNFTVDKGAVSNIISDSYQHCGHALTVHLADAMKDLGFEYATLSGVTISVSDIVVPKEKAAILGEAQAKVDVIWAKRKKGIITEREKDSIVTTIWDQATKDLTKKMEQNFPKLNAVYMMAKSGARGKMDQVRQLAAMRGLLVGPTGRVLDFPIKSNFREGLSVFEYFISTHGGRKGLVDTALNTADSGYLTRRLIDVALDMSVTELDCGTTEGIHLDMGPAEGSVKRVKKSILGRTLAQDVINTQTGQKVYPIHTEIDDPVAEQIHALGLQDVKVRSVLTCHTMGGCCSKCYGWDLASGRMSQVGDPCGVVAAQSIGEPGTQLTMRTFHTGGIAGRDITQGLPMVEMLFEVRGVKAPSILAEEDGDVVAVTEYVYDKVTLQALDGSREKTYEVMHADTDRLRIHFRSSVAKGDALDQDETAFSEFPGVVTQLFTDTHKTFWRIRVRAEDGSEREYETPHEGRRPLVGTGSTVKKGTELCEGDLDLRKFHGLMGDLATQLLITNKIQEIYESQNVNTNSKHIEVVTNQMIRFVEITEPGDVEDLFEGDVVDRGYFTRLMEERRVAKGKVPQGRSMLQGISKSSLSTKSFLAAASFQETTRVLTEAAIEGKVDNLEGLKENVIIGGLIPVGTGSPTMHRDENIRPETFFVDKVVGDGDGKEAESIF
nr:DNA-directed RNA polymerase subunit beta' [bacterium]